MRFFLNRETRSFWRKNSLVRTPSTSHLLAETVILVMRALPPPILQVPSTYPPPFQVISLPYCFRIVSASGSENDRRTIGERYGNDTGSIRDQYGINTGLIRDRYENGLFRLLTDEIDMNSNFFIIVPLDYILHFGHLPLPVVYTKKTGSPFALAQPLYKDNLPSSRMQTD